MCFPVPATGGSPRAAAAAFVCDITWQRFGTKTLKLPRITFYIYLFVKDEGLLKLGTYFGFDRLENWALVY